MSLTTTTRRAAGVGAAALLLGSGLAVLGTGTAAAAAPAGTTATATAGCNVPVGSFGLTVNTIAFALTTPVGSPTVPYEILVDGAANPYGASGGTITGGSPIALTPSVPDGTYDVSITVDGTPVLDQFVSLDCSTPAGTPTVAVTPGCDIDTGGLGGLTVDGIAYDISVPEGFGTRNYAVLVDGQANPYGASGQTVAPGTPIRLTPQVPDGTYQVQVLVDGASVFNQPVTVACNTPVPPVDTTTPSDLQVTAQTPFFVAPGQSFQSTITVTNAGATAVGPISTTFWVFGAGSVTDADGGTVDGALVRFTGAGLAAGASTSYTLTLTAPSGGAFGITGAFATSTTPDPNLFNNIAVLPTITG